jgi:hypothetical protein
MRSELLSCFVEKSACYRTHIRIECRYATRGPNSRAFAQRGRLDVVLDKLNANLTELIEAVECGGLDQLDAAQKLAWWQRFEAFRNKLPLIDHSLIADAEASDLAGSYGFSSLTRFVTRILQPSHGEAAARVSAAAAVGPRTCMLGEAPRAAACQTGLAATPRCGVC